MNELPLSAMRTGERATVTAIRTTSVRIEKLAALGVLPGVEICVHQKRPAIVIESGETVLALEPEMAETIFVSRL